MNLRKVKKETTKGKRIVDTTNYEITCKQPLFMKHELILFIMVKIGFDFIYVYGLIIPYPFCPIPCFSFYVSLVLDLTIAFSYGFFLHFLFKFINLAGATASYNQLNHKISLRLTRL